MSEPKPNKSGLPFKFFATNRKTRSSKSVNSKTYERLEPRNLRASMAPTDAATDSGIVESECQVEVLEVIQATSQDNQSSGQTFYIDPAFGNDANPGTADQPFASYLPFVWAYDQACLLYTSPSPRDQRGSRMPSSA